MQDLLKLTDEYEAPAGAKKLVSKMKIALVVGIAAAGKDSILREILTDKKHFSRIVTTISRKPRPNEIPDISYHFIDDDQVRENLEQHKYFEAKIVHGRIYGTTTSELARIHDSKKIAIGDIDVQGVEEYYRILDTKLKTIFIIPPDFATWQKRWSGRSDSNNEEEKHRRMVSAEAELDFALRSNYYQFVINDDLDEAAEISRKLIVDKTFAKKYNDSQAKQVARELHDAIAKELGEIHQFTLRLE